MIEYKVILNYRGNADLKRFDYSSKEEADIHLQLANDSGNLIDGYIEVKNTK